MIVAQVQSCTCPSLRLPIWPRNSVWWRAEAVYHKTQVGTAIKFGTFEDQS